MPTRRPQQPGAVASASPGVNAPFQGLFLDRPPHVIEPTGFSACNNCRVRFNQVWFKDMGWLVQILGASHGAPLYIPSADTPSIVGGGLFTLLGHGGYQYLIVITLGGDIYAVAYQSAPGGFVDPTLTGNASLITPVYNTGTVSSAGGTNANVTGAGTFWNTAIGTGWRTGARVGDYIGFGANNMSNPSSTWFLITAVNSDTSITLAGSVPVVGGGTSYTIRQRLSPNLTNARPSMEIFPNAGAPDNADLLFIVDGGGSQVPTTVDPIYWWNPSSGVAAGNYLSTVGFTCRRVRRFSNVMIYGNLLGVSGSTPAFGQGSTSIQSSDNGLPKSMASGVAFQGVVSDGPEPIQYLGVLGNQLLIYTGGQAAASISFSMSPGQGGSIVAASFVGLPTVWQFATVVRGRGTLGQGLVAEFADRHQFLAQDGEYRYNGMFLQVMNDHVFRNVVANIDYGNLHSAFNIVDTQAGEIMWVLPTSINGSSNIWAAYVEHYMEQANNYLFKPITVRDAGDQSTLITWQCFLGTAPNKTAISLGGRKGPLIGDSSGNILQIGLGAGDQQTFGSNSAQNITETCTFAARIVAGERSRGLIKRVYPFIDEIDSAGTQVTVTLQLWDRVGAAAAIADIQTYTTGTATRFTTHYRRGRVAQVKFTFTGGSGLNMLLDGYDWDLPRGSPGGQR